MFQALTNAAPRDLARLAVSPQIPAPTRAQIERLQSSMAPICTELPEPEHIFHPGWYERRLVVPAGMLVVGKIHRHAHPVGVIRGHALLLSEFGSAEVRGGYWAVSQPGVKRIVLAFEETLFVTLHRNERDTRDIAQIEADHIEPEAFTIERARAAEALQ